MPVEIKGIEKYKLNWKKDWNNLLAIRTACLGHYGGKDLFMVYADRQEIPQIVVEGSKTFNVDLPLTRARIVQCIAEYQNYPFNAQWSILINDAFKKDLKMFGFNDNEAEKVIDGVYKECHAYNNNLSVDLKITVEWYGE